MTRAKKTAAKPAKKTEPVEPAGPIVVDDQDTLQRLEDEQGVQLAAALEVLTTDMIDNDLEPEQAVTQVLAAAPSLLGDDVVLGEKVVGPLRDHLLAVAQRIWDDQHAGDLGEAGMPASAPLGDAARLSEQAERGGELGAQPMPVPEPAAVPPAAAGADPLTPPAKPIIVEERRGDAGWVRARFVFRGSQWSRDMLTPAAPAAGDVVRLSDAAGEPREVRVKTRVWLLEPDPEHPGVDVLCLCV